MGWYFILHIASIALVGVTVTPQWVWQSLPQWVWQAFGMAVNFGTPVLVPKPALKMLDQLSRCVVAWTLRPVLLLLVKETNT